MGWRFRRSVKVAPGVKVNIGSKSVGVSVGPRGAHVGYNTRMGGYFSAGLPGSGIYYRQNLGKFNLNAADAPRADTKAAPPPGPPQVGLPQVRGGGATAHSNAVPSAVDAGSPQNNLFGHSNPFLLPVPLRVQGGYGTLGVLLGCAMWLLVPLLTLSFSFTAVVFGFSDASFAGVLAPVLLWIGIIAGIACMIGGFIIGGQKDTDRAAQRQRALEVNGVAQRSWKAIGENRRGDALVDLQWLRTATPDNPDVLFYLSLCYAPTDLKRARGLMLEYLKHDKADAYDGFLNLGFLFTLIDDHANAAKAYLKAAELATVPVDHALATLNWCRALLATADYKRVLQIVDNVTLSGLPALLLQDYHVIRGVCYFQLGHREAARREWEQVLAANPQNPEALLGMQQL